MRTRSQLYRSGSLGGGAKFAVPTVVNSKVYVGNASKLVVFGPICNKVIALGRVLPRG
ncbi:MAG: hypothetical protein M3O09_16120 [Acidobacteriota bacterium]|nr:hypothetical protein [Acidobacteriota bacterium]